MSHKAIFMDPFVKIKDIDNKLHDYPDIEFNV